MFSCALLFSHQVMSDSSTLWTAAWQASLSFTISGSLLKLMSIESVIPSNHLILGHPLFLLPSIFPSVRVFSNESALHIRWPKYWSFSMSFSDECSQLISSLVAQMVENWCKMQKTQVWFLGGEDTLDKEMATHSSILNWRIPWTEQPGRLKSKGL